MADTASERVCACDVACAGIYLRDGACRFADKKERVVETEYAVRVGCDAAHRRGFERDGTDREGGRIGLDDVEPFAAFFAV